MGRPTIRRRRKPPVHRLLLCPSRRGNVNQRPYRFHRSQNSARKRNTVQDAKNRPRLRAAKVEGVTAGTVTPKRFLILQGQEKTWRRRFQNGNRSDAVIQGL